MVLYNLSRLFQVKGMVLTESVLPYCLMSNRQLHELFDKAIPQTAALIESFDAGSVRQPSVGQAVQAQL